MIVRIPRISSYLGEEEDVVIPLSMDGYYVLTLNFFEDTPGGRKGRFLVLRDSYGLVEETGKPYALRGKKTVVTASGVKEAWSYLTSKIRIERPLSTERVPLLYDIELSEGDTSSRGVRGFLNYVRIYGVPNLNGVSIQFKVEELV